MPKIKSDLSQLQDKVREYNKIVQSIIKEGIVKNRERRLMKIKLKDDDKKTYTFEQLQNAMKTNKHWLLYQQNPTQFIDILRGESTKKSSKNVVEKSVSNIEIIPAVNKSKKLEKSIANRPPIPWHEPTIRDLYRIKHFPNKPFHLDVDYSRYDEWLKKQADEFYLTYDPKDDMEDALTQFYRKLRASMYIGNK